MTEQEMKIKIEELETELQQYKAFLADIERIVITSLHESLSIGLSN